MNKSAAALLLATLAVASARAHSDPVGRLYFDLLGNDSTEGAE